jgi:adenylosuccinate lyase
LDNIDWRVADAKEREIRHDVMAHVFALGEVAPKAKPIIHLGATSAFVGDNAEIIQMRDSMVVVRRNLVRCMKLLRDAAVKYRDVPTLGFTHFQPAQLTTYSRFRAGEFTSRLNNALRCSVGKRMCLWLQDFALDYAEVDRWARELPLLGVKGTTGSVISSSPRVCPRSPPYPRCRHAGLVPGAVQRRSRQGMPPPRPPVPRR